MAVSNQPACLRALVTTLFLASMLAISTLTLAEDVEPTRSNPTITVNTNLHGIVFDGMCSLFEAIANVSLDKYRYTDCGPGSYVDPPQQVDILLEEGIGSIDLMTPYVLRKPARIIGPSASDKTILTSTNGWGLVIFESSATSGQFELRNLRFEDIVKDADVPNVGSRCESSGAALCVAFTNAAQQLSIVDVDFFDNRVRYPSLTNGGEHGGAVYIYDLDENRPNKSQVIMERTIFQGNTAHRAGGAAYLSGVDVSIRNTQFFNNYAGTNVSNYFGSGAGLYAVGGNAISMLNSTFQNNSVEGTINAVAAAYLGGFTSILISNSWFENNQAFSFAFGNFVEYVGAAVSIDSSASQRGNLFMVNSYFGENTTAGLKLFNVDGTIASSTFFENRYIGRPGQLMGAGLSMRDSSIDIFNSTILGNSSPSSGVDEFGVGGIDAENSMLTLEHVTIAKNETVGPPRVGGLQLDGSTATLRGTLLAENFGTVNGNIGVFGGSILSVHSSQFGDDASEINGTNTANVFADTAMLDPVQDMGCSVLAGAGPSARCVPLAPLAAGAVALDRSDPSTALTTDQRGLLFTRRAGGGSVPDIGAHELQPAIVSIQQTGITQLTEGNSGNTPFPFILHRNGDKRAATFAGWNIFGQGSAPADAGDFAPSSWVGGSAFFDVGSETAGVTVNVTGDTASEPNEGFRLQLAGITNGVQGSDSSRSAVILNDDGLIPSATISLAPVAVDLIEGDFIAGSEQTFRITRSQVLGGVCSFQVELSGIGPAGVSSDDFINWSLGTQTFVMLSGAEFVDITLQVRGDGLYEGDEAFRLGLINPSGCFIDSTAASVDALIVDDESLISITSLSSSQPEGTGGPTEYSFQVTRAGYLDDTDSVSWSASGSGAHPASANDFASGTFPTGTLGFPPGVDSAAFSLMIEGDAIEEMDEGFTVELSSVIGGELATSSANATILNDDTTSDQIFSDRFQ